MISNDPQELLDGEDEVFFLDGSGESVGFGHLGEFE